MSTYSMEYMGVSSSEGGNSSIAISVQGHAPIRGLNLGYAGVVMPIFTRDEVIGPGPWVVGWSAIPPLGPPHPLEEGGARWRTRSSDKSVNMRDFHWHLRLEKRKASVSAIQESEAYRTLRRNFGTLEAWGENPCASAFPKLPDCTDRALSKRACEVQCMAYRVAIGQMCRDEGLDLNMVMSRSGGGIAQLAPPAMSALPGRFDADQTAIWREHQEGEEGHADLQTCRRADGQRREKTDTGTGREEDMCSGLGPAPAVGRQQPPQWTWRGRIRDWHGTWALSLGMAPGQGMGMAPGWGMTLGIALDIAMGHGTGHDQPSGVSRSSVIVIQ